jgi:hypothetical protein
LGDAVENRDRQAVAVWLTTDIIQDASSNRGDDPDYWTAALDVVV